MNFKCANFARSSSENQDDNSIISINNWQQCHSLYFIFYIRLQDTPSAKSHVDAAADQLSSGPSNNDGDSEGVRLPSHDVSQL